MYKIFSRLVVILLLSILAVSSTPLTAYANGKNTPSGIEYSNLKNVIDDYVKEYIGNTTAGAAVAVLQNDKTIFRSNYGYSDIKNQIAVSDNTVFEWGSTSKLLIWVSAMQLAEQGKLDLNKDIKAYLPKNFFHKLQFGQPITMINLMNHNAGWEEHLTDMFYKNPKDMKSLKETLEVFEPKQIYKPGEVVAYSNYGAALAAYIIERITGMKFYEYVDKYIFDVLNMNETSIEPLQRDNLYLHKNRLLAKGYVKNSKGFTEGPILYIGLYPAGGAVGTLSDMCKFVSALVPKDGKKSTLFKDEKTLKTMYSKSYEATDDFPGICHGFWEHYYSVRVLEHGGNTDTFSSQIAFAPEEGTAVVVMTNQSHEQPLCVGIKDKIFGSYKADEFENELPDSSIVEGKYRYMRRPYSGFSQWLNFTVSEVTKIDSKSIDIDGDVYHEISPYVYQYTDEGGASELAYFRVRNRQVISMYQEYGEYEPAGTTTIIMGFGRLILFAVCLIYFLTSSVISLIYGLKRRGNLSFRDKKMILLNWTGFLSTVNTVILFTRSTMYPSYAGLKVHFAINILSAVFIISLLGGNFIMNIIRKARNEKKMRYVLTDVFSILYVTLIITCQIYK